MFLVRFKRLGRHRDVSRRYVAKSIGALEAPIKEDVERILSAGEATTEINVTINVAAQTGQLDYGLKGEFTIVA
jgi:hypothetical protein